MNYLVTIIGPTAIGKTSLSIALAQHFGCDIVSCDSRQFYREMAIGTAVPSGAELEAAPHHFIQNKSILDTYTVGDYEQEALALLDKLFTKNNIQILVGGSGLYVDAILKGFDDFPAIDPSVREHINAAYDQHGLVYLQEQLQALDPEFYQKLSIENPQTLQNPQRMKRFVEVCQGSNQPYSSFIGQKQNSRSFTPIVIGLDAERDILYQRINQRVDIMQQEGLLAEVEGLVPHKERNALQTVGYRELFAYLDGQCTLDFALEEIKKNTRRFAKRQMTWFKRTEHARWFDYATERETIINFIESQIR